MKILQKPNSKRIRIDGNLVFNFGDYNYSLFQGTKTQKKNHHHTLSYSFERKDFDIHITREKPSKKYYGLLKFDLKSLNEIADKFILSMAEYIRNNIITMNVSPGLERDGLFQFSIPQNKRATELFRDYADIFTEHKNGEINLITENEKLIAKARKSGKFKQVMAAADQIQREGFKMRLWNFRTAIVTYHSLDLIILAYDKGLRKMKCLDLNKIMNGSIFQPMADEALGLVFWRQIEERFTMATEAMEAGKDELIPADPIWLE